MSDDDPVDTAAEELYGAPLSAFTAERKRLADAARGAGDRKAAAAIAKLAKPSMGAWVVNRLYREARDDVDALFAAGARLRRGDPSATDEQRAAVARLRARAAQVLVADEHAASPATLQRVTTTLQALSASGTFEPDRPGQLTADRDPPGFDVIAAAPPPRPHLTLVPPAPETREAAERAEREAAERAERERAAERARRERAVQVTETAVRQRTAEVEALRKNLDAAIAVVDNLGERLRVAEDALADARGRADAALAERDEPLP